MQGQYQVELQLRVCWVALFVVSVQKGGPRCSERRECRWVR